MRWMSWSQDGTITIAPVRRVSGKYSLPQLVARMPKNYKAEEVDWGRPVGKETW
jgi:antitoxin component of MazEF toxin-antitoxin module